MKGEFKAYLKSKGFTKGSIRTRMITIEKYWQWLRKENLEASEVSYNDLLLYMKHCQRKRLTQRTIQHYIGVIKHFYNHLLEQGQIAVNPATDIEVKGVKRKSVYYIFTPQELHQLYNSYQDETLAGRRNKAMLGLLTYQGLKTEELAKLELHNIKLREGKVDVPGSRRSNHRLMTLEGHQVLDLYDYVQVVRPELINQEPMGKGQPDRETQRLFIGAGGNSKSFHNFTGQLIRALKATNAKLENGKQIRASVIVKWLKNHNLREAQVLAGHKFISTTEAYKQSDMEGLKEEVNQFHPF